MKSATPTPSHRFPSTHWSGVYLARQLDMEKGRMALDNLLRQYLPALKGYLQTRFHADAHQSEDWMQSFVLNRILEKELLKAARPECGRFRTFLLTALNNFVVSQIRYQNRQKRKPEGDCLELAQIALREEDVSAGAGPGNSEFDRRWAVEVLRMALQRMEARCQETGRCDIWEVFQGRFVGPILHDQPLVGYETLAARFSLRSPVQAANLLTTGKRMFQRTLRGVVAEYAASESEINQEIQELLAILSQG
ncbi:MAG: sigma-70 family RNA polymerase sigma factor [Verrucomicrobia bacterium]|nr:sigma-70 family RNA polymerase sigma factor [Verrucomicrobiota bacterium]